MASYQTIMAAGHIIAYAIDNPLFTMGEVRKVLEMEYSVRATNAALSYLSPYFSPVEYFKSEARFRLKKILYEPNSSLVQATVVSYLKMNSRKQVSELRVAGGACWRRNWSLPLWQAVRVLVRKGLVLQSPVGGDIDQSFIKLPPTAQLQP